jgi:hypothetical protein
VSNFSGSHTKAENPDSNNSNIGKSYRVGGQRADCYSSFELPPRGGTFNEFFGLLISDRSICSCFAGFDLCGYDNEALFAE